ncbi:MAG: hypothetical protein ACI9LO_000550 [Planctomycetota bacterium]|jgi:hypothetical protein
MVQFKHFLRSILLITISLLVMLVPVAVQADSDDPFVIEFAEFTLVDSFLFLDMSVHSELPEYIAIAVDQGFAVPLMFEVEIRVDKKYWIDDKILSLKQQYLLHFIPILDSYTVLDVNKAERYYFDNREAAVDFLELVYNYPMFDISNLEPGLIYYARARFGVDTDQLPLPLKSSSLWDNDWDIQSDWFKWPLSREQQ